MEKGANKSSKQSKTSESKGAMNQRKQKNGGFNNEKGYSTQYVPKANSHRDAGSDQHQTNGQN